MNVESQDASDRYPETLEHAKHCFQLNQRFFEHDDALFQVIQSLILEVISRNPYVRQRVSSSGEQQFRGGDPKQRQRRHLQTAMDRQPKSKVLRSERIVVLFW